MSEKKIPAITSRNIWEDERPGAFAFEEKRKAIVYICPCGCGQTRSVPICEREKAPHAWLWDGVTDRPTLTPSILIIGECGWHGFLTSGEWVTC